MADDDIVARVKRKIGKVQDLRRQRAEQFGQKTQLLKQLNDEYEVESADAGEALLEEYVKTVITNESALVKMEGEIDGIIELATAPKPE